jgi:diguanylate cyclase (GGDEF)-like protein/PAS domain S-box-containing protein
VLDTQGRFTYVNDATLFLFKLPKADIIGKTCTELGFGFANEIQLCLQQVLASSHIVSDEFCFNFSPDRVFECVFAPVVSKPENTVQSIVVMAHDITLRKAAEEQSWQQANHDQLTGLPNRRLFLYQLQQDFNHAERFGLAIALLFIDLDGFKAVNDTLGHEAGDVLLRLAADRLNTCVRESDTIARLGGDEFTVLLKGMVDVEQTRIVAQKILDALIKPFHSQQDIMRISGSIGIAFYPGDASTQEGLIKAADHAMYEAKRQGRNQISFARPSLALAGQL